MFRAGNHEQNGNSAMPNGTLGGAALSKGCKAWIIKTFYLAVLK